MGGMDSPMGGPGDFFYQGESEGEYSYASYGHHGGGAYNVEESSLHSPAAINFNGWDWRIFQSLVQAKVSTFLAGGRSEDEEFEFENDLPDACDVEHTGTTWRDYSNGGNGNGNDVNGGNQQSLYGKQHHPASSSSYRIRGNTNNMGAHNGHDYMGGRSGSFDSVNDDEIDPYNTLSASLTSSFDPMVCDHPVMASSSGSGGGSLGGGSLNGGSLGSAANGGGQTNTSNVGMKHLVDGLSVGGSTNGGSTSGGDASGGAGGASTWNRSNGGRGTKRAGDTTIPTPSVTTSSSAGGGSHGATGTSTSSTSRARGERRRMVADCKVLRAQITSFEADWTKTHGMVHPCTISFLSPISTISPLSPITILSLYQLSLIPIYSLFPSYRKPSLSYPLSYTILVLPLPLFLYCPDLT